MQILHLFARVLKIGADERRLSVLFVVAAVFIAGAQILEPVLFGDVIDALAKEQQLINYVAMWMGIGFINAALSIFLAVVSDRYAHRQRLRAMEAAFERTISLPYRYHSLNGSGKVVRTIQMGCDQVFSITLSFFRENMIALASIVMLVPLAFYLDIRLATALCVLALVYTSCNWFVIRHTHERQAQVELKHQELAARLIDVMANVSIVRSFTRVLKETELFKVESTKVLRAQYPVLNWWGVLNTITRLSAMIAMLTIVIIGSLLVRSGTVTQGQVVTFVGFSTLLINRLDQFSSFVNRMVSQMPATKNLLQLIDHVGDEDVQPDKPTALAVQGRVEFQGVSYRFGPQNQIGPGVFDLNFVAEPGQTVALVGPTGAGKSTCLSLLQRLYTPDTGRITIDTHDVAELGVQTLCRTIATVFQEPGLFNRSIYDNILVGRPDATRDEVEEAARRAYAHEFIVSRPGGYDFVVGERGLALSGGERQRIAIARAILKDAPILVLDEATSALDNETERYVQQAMDKLRRGKTTFVIAHRLSTILGADRILVMQDGRIVQNGTYDELRAEDGIFARLVNAGDIGGAIHSADIDPNKKTRQAEPAGQIVH
ncbi:MAG: ATP-binding cassette domain-containing protein [Deltaproteobacteria bacterium]|nr:ATP-binding cassette domain-containing protein [Deltaproteobacteria bacterium]